MIEVICKNNQVRKLYPMGVTLDEIKKDLDIKMQYPVLGGLVNNRLRELSYELYKPKTIEFIDISNDNGRRMYSRSVIFVMSKAIMELFPDTMLEIDHTVPGGFYCELKHFENELTDDIIKNIETRMKQIASDNLPFIHQRLLTEDAIKIFETMHFKDKITLLKSRSDLYTSVYQLGHMHNYFYGNLLSSTGYIDKFELQKCYKGIFLKLPNYGFGKASTPLKTSNSKLFKVFQEHVEWLDILGVPHVGDLNKSVIEKKSGDLIKVSEALHEKKIASIADEIAHKKNGNTVKIVLISGPSSSGKTTFCKRLSVQLQVLGFQPLQISLDDYFVNREHTPRDEKGDYNFESLEAIDIKFFNEQLLQLINGQEVEIPVFDFIKGERTFVEKKLKMKERSIILIEGIHGLNPALTPMIEDKSKFKIFVSALTHLAIDAHNPIPSTDNRLIRRIVRDYRFRGYDALSTLQRWGSVRAGEEKYIFPYQENADIMFNSALPFELGVLKKFAEPLLNEVPETHVEYAEANRLLKFFSYFKNIEEQEIPPTSILLEFIGGSSFAY